MASLPDIPGPKLRPFNTKGKPLQVDFIRHLGKGVHAHVWKVRINGEVYALKMFIFGHHYTRSDHWRVQLSDEDQERYMHPSSCESRAYGRLKELNKEHLAVPCYGYLLLDEEHQARLRDHYASDWEAEWGYCPESQGQPLKALVKKFVEFPTVDEYDPWDDASLRRITRAIDCRRTATRLIRNMKTLHRCGILNRDINSANISEGLFLDFSTAWTVPHPCLSTPSIQSKRGPITQLGMCDALAVDELIDQWNQDHAFGKRIWDRAGPQETYLGKLRSHAGFNERNPKRFNWNRGYSLRPDKYKWEPSEKKLAARRHQV